MQLQPMNDAIMALPIEHVDEDKQDLLNELTELTNAARPDIAARELRQADNSVRLAAAQTEDTMFAMYQVSIIAVGPDCQDVAVGDTVIIPPDSGTMVTVIDPETQEYRRVYLNNEHALLAKVLRDAG